MTTRPAPALPDLGDSALQYASVGIPVFPCIPGGKTPLTNSGFHAATTDLDLIAGWWRWQPNANIAIPTGTGTFDVLDIDIRPGGSGYTAYHTAKKAGLVDGWTKAVRTPSGGLHLYYPGTDQRNSSLPSHHLDLRANGGYVLVPPSLGQTKTHSRRYELVESRPGPGRPLDWSAIASLLRSNEPPREYHSPSRIDAVDPVPRLAAHVARQSEGNRNNALFWAACRATEAGRHNLDPLVAAGVYAGLTEHEASRTVESARTTILRTTSPTQPQTPTAHAGLHR